MSKLISSAVVDLLQVPQANLIGIWHTNINILIINYMLIYYPPLS
jgi:hypothetical protein